MYPENILWCPTHRQVAPDGAPGPAKARREGGVTGGGYILKEPFWEIGKYETDDVCVSYDIPKMRDDVDDLVFLLPTNGRLSRPGKDMCLVWEVEFSHWNRYVKHCTGHDCWSLVLICWLCFSSL